jgi:DNA polymerase-3 subunit epsilon
MPGPFLNWRRRRLHRLLEPGPLRDFYAVPLPRAGLDYRDVPMLAIDLETTGLDPRKDQILSFGWVGLNGDRIELSQARHRLVRVRGEIPAESAVIHQITDDQAAAGGHLPNALAELLQALAGRVMIAHHARVEQGFLSMACRRLFGAGLLVPTIDTQALARRTLERRHIPYKGSDLRLHALGERYNLPRYGAHNALADAIAAAELFLAQAAHRDGGGGVQLRDLLS